MYLCVTYILIKKFKYTGLKLKKGSSVIIVVQHNTKILTPTRTISLQVSTSMLLIIF